MLGGRRLKVCSSLDAEQTTSQANMRATNSFLERPNLGKSIHSIHSLTHKIVSIIGRYATIQLAHGLLHALIFKLLFSVWFCWFGTSVCFFVFLLFKM